MPRPISDWLYPVPYADGGGVWCAPGGFHVDPSRGVERALITHGHADHARWGNKKVMATPETLAIMRARYADGAYETCQAAAYGERIKVGDVTVSFHPAGHVLGSAQIKIEYQSMSAVMSGDYKRQPDPTCPAFEPQACDVFVTEATFALPVFCHPPIRQEMEKLLAANRLNPDRAIVIGAYSLGKAQRVIMELRAAGYDAPIYLHGAMLKLCALYQELGCDLGTLIPVSAMVKKELRGQVIIAPPSALADRWSNSLPDVLPALASGWMRVRQRAKQKGIELPLVISDHADWFDLQKTVAEVNPGEVWITHGREDAFLRQLELDGRAACALDIVRDEGGEEGEEEPAGSGTLELASDLASDSGT